MPQKERVRKLATRLGVAPEAVLERLSTLGHARYRSPEDMLPPEAVSAVQAAFREASRSAPGRPLAGGTPSPPRGGAAGRPVPLGPRPARPEASGDLPGLSRELRQKPEAWVETFAEAPFADALAGYLGARKSGERPALDARSRGEAEAATSRETPATPSATEAALRESLGAALVARRRAEDALEEAEREIARLRGRLHEAGERIRHAEESARGGAAREQEALSERLAASEEEGMDLRAELDGARRSLRAAAESRDLAERAREEATARAREAEARQAEAEGRTAAARAREKAVRDRLEATLASAPQEARPADPDRRDLAGLLRERGLRDHEEQRAALDALLIDHRIDATLEGLAAVDAGSFARQLRQKTALTCGACQPPSGRTAIEVGDPSRCEICQGSATRKSAQEFLDACRRAGILKINVVGGSPSYFAELQGLLGETLDLRAVDGTMRLDRQRARQHVEGADLTLVWGATILDHAVSGLYSGLGDPRVVLIPHRGIGGMLRKATRAVEARGGAER